MGLDLGSDIVVAGSLILVTATGLFSSLLVRNFSLGE